MPQILYLNLYTGRPDTPVLKAEFRGEVSDKEVGLIMAAAFTHLAAAPDLVSWLQVATFTVHHKHDPGKGTTVWIEIQTPRSGYRNRWGQCTSMVVYGLEKWTVNEGGIHEEEAALPKPPPAANLL